MSTAPSNNFDFQNYFSATLQSDITSGSLSLTLDNVPTPVEGILILEPDSSTNREIIFYTGKTASTVTLPSDGRGWDSTTATAHLTGSTVVMAPTAYMLRMLKAGSLFDSYSTGWTNLGQAPNAVVANGNRSYTLTFPSTVAASLSPGMRLRSTRTVAAPTQCTSLNGTTQYYSKTSPAGMTFTNNFVVSAWVKLSSYATGAIVARTDGTSGWEFKVNSSGQLLLVGYNAGGGNSFISTSYQSLPLNKWVHVAAQLDMSTTSVGTTNNYIMIDGVEVPNSVARAGTNPTSLLQGTGSLQIGASNGAIFFPGKIAQVAIYSAKVTEATILASMHQGLAGTETSLISAYSFNGVLTDLNANANTLTANGSAVATNADSPFGGQADGTISSTLDYAIVTKVATTSVTCQVPEGCTIPTSGGVTSMTYSVMKAPYGMPIDVNKWRLASILMTASATTSNATYGSFLSNGWALNAPIGAWKVGWMAGLYSQSVTAVGWNLSPTALTGLTLAQGNATSRLAFTTIGTAALATYQVHVESYANLAAATTYTMYTLGAVTSSGADAAESTSELFAEFSLL